MRVTASSIIAAGCILGASLSGCAGLPGLQDLESPPSKIAASKSEPDGPTLAMLVAHIQCELSKAYEASKDPNTPYLAEVNLQIDAVENSAIAPALSYINPYSTPTYNFTLAVSGQIGRMNHENITYYFPVVFDDMQFDASKACAEPGGKTLDAGTTLFKPERAIKGDIGLTDAVFTAIQARKATVFQQDTQKFDPVTPPDILGFVISTDFTVTRSVGGGPNWTLMHFKGPGGGGSSGGSGGSGSSGGSGGGGGGSGQQNLLSWSKVAKDSLIVSFVPITKDVQTNLDQAEKDANNKVAQAYAALDKARQSSQDAVKSAARLAKPVDRPQFEAFLSGRADTISDNTHIFKNLDALSASIATRHDIPVATRNASRQQLSGVRKGIQDATDTLVKAQAGQQSIAAQTASQRSARTLAIRSAQDAITREILLQTIVGR